MPAKEPEWFRRNTWSDADREAFNARLNRSRGASHKAQYLRIQAGHLAEAGHHPQAIGLLDRLFSEFPEKFELAQAHAQKADSLAKLGQVEAAIDEFRAALQCERNYPNVRTTAWLDFGWLVVVLQLIEYHDEVSRTLLEFRKDSNLNFPALKYRYNAIQAILADARGDKSGAREFARQALTEATRSHSGFHFHPKVGLVGPEQKALESRLRALAGT